jgi:hypothetical protein
VRSSWRGGARSQRCGEVSFFRTVTERVDEETRDGRWTGIAAQQGSKGAFGWTDQFVNGWDAKSSEMLLSSYGILDNFF